MGETNNCPVDVGSLKLLTSTTAWMVASGVCSVQSSGRVADGNWRQIVEKKWPGKWEHSMGNYPTFIEAENSSTPFLWIFHSQYRHFVSLRKQHLSQYLKVCQSYVQEPCISAKLTMSLLPVEGIVRIWQKSEADRNLVTLCLCKFSPVVNN